MALQYPSKYQSLIEITRHYMLVIYLIGLLESFIKALFPLNFIPLVVGFKNWRKRHGVFVLLLAGSYLLLSYYFLITRDFIRVRYFLTPVLLLCPWIGLGMRQNFRLCERFIEATLFYNFSSNHLRTSTLLQISENHMETRHRPVKGW